MPKPLEKPSRRLDLQGIRGLAIIVVLGFHFFPDVFPNGYLGVDQFFVLSGFLMCMLLKRAEFHSPFSLIGTFYSKRFNRILPLYLLVIFLSMLALYQFFPDTAIETNQKSAAHALLFTSNRPKTNAEDYFQMLSIAIDIFTHTWSLSVEIQFYFLVPFMFLIASRFPEKFQYIFYSVIGLLSFFFYSTSSPTVAFNSVFARIWQFLIGMLVYLKTNSRSQQNGYKPLKSDEKDDIFVGKLSEEEPEEPLEDGNSLRSRVGKYLLLISLVIITTYPLSLADSITRPYITIFTGFLMLISEEDFVLSNRVLTYIGDISYSLYLIHWPIYAYWKLTAEGNQTKLFLSLTAAIVLAIITFETFEKWYLRLSTTAISLLVIILFLLNVVVINKEEIKDHFDTTVRNTTRIDGITDQMTMDDAEDLNYRWGVNDADTLYSSSCVYEEKNTPLGWCRHSGLSKEGKFKLAIFGNSWAANHARLFYEECGYKAKSILQGSAYACEPLYPTWNHSMCIEKLRDFENRIQAEKPDIGFIIMRFLTVGDPSDTIYEVMRNQTMKYLESVTKKLYILHAIPRVWQSGVNRIVPMLKNHTNPVEIDNKLLDFTGYKIARERFNRLKKDCGEKCELIDYTSTFFNETTNNFRYFDERGFSFWTQALHLSPRGLEVIRPFWNRLL